MSDLSDLGGGGGEGQHELVSALHVFFIMIAILKYTTWCHFSERHCSRTAPQRHIYTRNSSDEGVGILLILLIILIIIANKTRSLQSSPTTHLNMHLTQLIHLKLTKSKCCHKWRGLPSSLLTFQKERGSAKILQLCRIKVHKSANFVPN